MYGDKRNNRKINFYDKATGRYLGSTTWARNCREAREQYKRAHGLEVKASYK